MESADPRMAPADRKNKEIQWTVVTDPYSKNMSVIAIDGDRDDDAHDGDDTEHGNRDARRSDL